MKAKNDLRLLNVFNILAKKFEENQIDRLLAAASEMADAILSE